MATDDKDPRSVMSRNQGDSQVVSGARRLKHRSFIPVHRETWPANPDEALSPKSESQPSAKSTKTKRIPKEKAVKQKNHRETWMNRPNTAAIRVGASSGASTSATTC